MRSARGDLVPMAAPRARRPGKAEKPAAKRKSMRARPVRRRAPAAAPAPAPTPMAPNLLVAKLAEAAWEQADAALAQALADFDEWETAPDAAARKLAREMLGQSLAQAARRRGLV